MRETVTIAELKYSEIVKAHSLRKSENPFKIVKIRKIWIHILYWLKF